MTLEVRCLDCGSRGGYSLFANGCPYCIEVLAKPPSLPEPDAPGYVHVVPSRLPA